MTVSALRYTLIVRNPETGAPVALLAGKPVPGWATDLVHPDDLTGAEPEPSKRAPTKKAAAKRSSSK